MRGDVARLGRCTAICTQGEDTIKRSKPLKYAYEKEIVMYAYFKNLTYHSTECIYSPDAYRGHARVFLKDLELARPSAIIDIIHSGEAFSLAPEEKEKGPALGTCKRCGYMSSNELCKACTLLEGLERGIAESGIVSLSSGYHHNMSYSIYIQSAPSRLIELERSSALPQKGCGQYPCTSKLA